MEEWKTKLQLIFFKALTYTNLFDKDISQKFTKNY